MSWQRLEKMARENKYVAGLNYAPSSMLMTSCSIGFHSTEEWSEGDCSDVTWKRRDTIVVRSV